MVRYSDWTVIGGILQYGVYTAHRSKQASVRLDGRRTMICPAGRPTQVIIDNRKWFPIGFSLQHWAWPVAKEMIEDGTDRPCAWRHILP
jgi:hypothetical protein